MKIFQPLVVFTATALLTLSAYSQKIKITEGSLDVLKNEKDINIEYTYNNLAVGKFDKEADYVKNKTEELNKKEAGKGDKWAEAWTADRKNRFEPKFNELFTKTGELNFDYKAKYTLIFHTSFMEPGFNIGIASKSASINGDFTLVETANRNKVIAKGTIDKAPGRSFWGSDFDTGERISECYAAAGKYLAKKIK